MTLRDRKLLEHYRRRHETLELLRQRFLTRSSWCRRLIGWAYKVGGRTAFNMSVENFRQVGEAAVIDREITNKAIILMRRCASILNKLDFVDARDPYVVRDAMEFIERNKLQ